MVIQQRFDDDPLMGSAKELLHYEWAYDRNRRVVQEQALSDVTDVASAQTTRHAYKIECNPCNLIMEDSIRVKRQSISIAGALTIKVWHSLSKPVEFKHSRCCCCFEVSIDVTYSNMIAQGGGGQVGVYVFGSGGEIGATGAPASGGAVGKTWTVDICGCRVKR